MKRYWSNNTAALLLDGATSPVTQISRTWNGLHWTEVTELNTASKVSGSGTSTAGLFLVVRFQSA